MTEGDEYFFASLTDVVAASVVDGTATGTIIDDDVAAGSARTWVQAVGSMGSPAAPLAACDTLIADIVELEMQAATHRLEEAAGIARIIAMEKSAARLRCKRP